jgi:hypothetical protein
MFHPIDLGLKVPAPVRSQAVCLPSTGDFLLFETFDPLVIEQAAQRTIQSASTQYDPAVAHALNIFQNGVAVPRLCRQTHENQQDGLCEWQELHYGLRRHVA